MRRLRDAVSTSNDLQMDGGCRGVMGVLTASGSRVLQAVSWP